MSSQDAPSSLPDLAGLREQARRRVQAGEFSSGARALLAIAREHGFRTWPRLKTHVEARTLDSEERARMLLASLASEDVRRALALLEADPALACHDLACACACGEPDEVARQLALRPGLAGEPVGPNGWEPLLYACFSRLGRVDAGRAEGIREVVRRLLAAGADPNAAFVQREWLQVALYGAAGIAGDPTLTSMLLEAGAEPSDEREGLHGNEVLYHACELPDPTCARLVIDAGAHSQLVSHCLGRALNFPNAEMAAMFVGHGVRAEAGHLHQAVWRRRPARTVLGLLDAGAPIAAPDEHGLTPQQIAALWGERELVAVLGERGADTSSVGTLERAMGAYLAGETGVPSELPSTALLAEMLILAIQGGHADTVTRLLDAGAAPDGDPEAEERPLAEACWRGRAEIAGELMRRGAALVFPDEGSAIGAVLHGSRHCQEPEGGPTMATVQEIDHEPYRAIAGMLLDAGAAVPERLGGGGACCVTLLAELGVDPPA